MSRRTRVQTNKLTPGAVILTALVAPINGRGGVLRLAHLIRGAKPATVTAVTPYADGRGHRAWRIVTTRGTISGCVGLQRALIADPFLDGEPFREGDLESGSPITWHDSYTPADDDPGTPGVFERYESHGPTGDRGVSVKLDAGKYAGRSLSTGEHQVRRAR